MHAFRQREDVYAGEPANAWARREWGVHWSVELLQERELDAVPLVANDPFFGWCGRMLAVTKREEILMLPTHRPVVSSWPECVRRPLWP